jgi:mannose-6-phosphate isomerase-like protein (cupin superfamily)
MRFLGTRQACVHAITRMRSVLTMNKLHSIHHHQDWFQVLDGTKRSQAAVMRLDPGKATGEEAEDHPDSDQVLLVTEGQIEGEIAGEKVVVRAGEFVLIPAGTKHRFVNTGDVPALTFNVYASPAYPEEE